MELEPSVQQHEPRISTRNQPTSFLCLPMRTTSIGSNCKIREGPGDPGERSLGTDIATRESSTPSNIRDEKARQLVDVSRQDLDE